MIRLIIVEKRIFDGGKSMIVFPFSFDSVDRPGTRLRGLNSMFKSAHQWGVVIILIIVP